jgi:hypothetical protein
MPSFCHARVLVGRCSQSCQPRNRLCIDRMPLAIIGPTLADYTNYLGSHMPDDHSSLAKTLFGPSEDFRFYWTIFGRISKKAGCCG